MTTDRLVSSGGVRLSPLGTSATIWLICTSHGRWLTMSVKQQVECLVGETVVLGENLSQCDFVHHKSHIT
jgi:hypothetical protein